MLKMHLVQNTKGALTNTKDELFMRTKGAADKY